MMCFGQPGQGLGGAAPEHSERTAVECVGTVAEGPQVGLRKSGVGGVVSLEAESKPGSVLDDGAGSGLRPSPASSKIHSVPSQVTPDRLTVRVGRDPFL